MNFLKQFLLYAKSQKKWGIIIVMVFLFILGAVLILSHGSAIAPFIYTLF